MLELEFKTMIGSKTADLIKPQTKNKIDDLKKRIRFLSDRGGLSDRPKLNVVEEYIEACIIDYIQLLSTNTSRYEFIRVVGFDNENGGSHKLPVCINIFLYKNRELYDKMSHNSVLSLCIEEVGYNCSSALVRNLTGSVINTNGYGTTTSLSNATAFVKVLMNSVEELLKLLNYTKLMYTTSDKETFQPVIDYMEANYKCIQSFKSVRTNANIKWFVKELWDYDEFQKYKTANNNDDF